MKKIGVLDAENNPSKSRSGPAQVHRRRSRDNRGDSGCDGAGQYFNHDVRRQGRGWLIRFGNGRANDAYPQEAAEDTFCFVLHSTCRISETEIKINFHIIN